MTSILNNALAKIPRLHLYVITVLLIFLVVQSILRVLFWIDFSNPADPVSTADLWWSFYLGMKFDLQASLGTLLPVLLLGWIKPLHPVYSKWGRRLWDFYILLAIIVLYLVYAVDAGHYAYLEQRVNATALRFLENPLISATMVWQTYPVISGGLLLCLLVALTFVVYKKSTGAIRHDEDVRRFWGDKRWGQKTLLVIFTVLLVFFSLMAKISWYPLRWSDAFFSTHAFSSQLASNPVIYFSNTLKNVAETYDLEATQAAYPTMVDYLGVQSPDPSTLNYLRSFSFDRQGMKKQNVVIVILESFASYKTSLSGNPLHTTPHIADLAEHGFYYPNYFSPTTGTARSVWTVITGMPDIEKNKTSSRNPLIVDQHTIVTDFKDYKKMYFLGGSASWANIRGLLSSNIPDLELFEEGSYDSPDVDVWGISDLSLFREANAVLKKTREPFFAIIQTSGNHRPYTIPDDNEGFELWSEADIDGDVQQYGFASIEELNSFRFMDHSIGHFIELARKEPYFDNTLFVFFGDHGIHAATGNHVPPSEAQLHLQGLRVPLVFYGKGVIEKPAVFDTIASEVDVLPTIATLTANDYHNTTLGRSLLSRDEKNNELSADSYADKRYAFTIEHGTDRTIGLVSDKYYLQMQSNGSNTRLHDLASGQARDNVAQQHPRITEDMRSILAAMWDTILYMRENNKPADQE